MWIFPTRSSIGLAQKYLYSPLIFEHPFNIFFFFFFFNGSLEEKIGIVKIDAPSAKVNGFSLLEKFQ